MNVPVPPVFLYEKQVGQYEVMDGQQRLNHYRRFFDQSFRAFGSKELVFPEWQTFLGPSSTSSTRPGKRKNIRDYANLRPRRRFGRHRGPSAPKFFERLNTGGERLNPQELRNALWGGPFNDLLIETVAKPPVHPRVGHPRLRGEYLKRRLARGTPKEQPVLQENDRRRNSLTFLRIQRD